MVKVKNHYNIDLDFVLENGCSKTIRKDWQFDQDHKNFITEATISLTPTENHILTNIDEEQKIVFDSGGSSSGSLIVPAGSYTLTELLGFINTNFIAAGINNTLTVITEGANYGKCELEINRYVNYSLAPQIRQILKLKIDYDSGEYITDEVIDITRNLQNIKLFCSLLNASSSRIANQNNDLLCTINLESLEEPHIETIRNLSVPVFNRVNSIALYFQDENLHDVKMNCNVHITLHINSYDANQDDKTANAATKDRAQLLTQFTNLSLELTKANESIQLPETVNLPSNTFIERVSVLLDGHIHNILEDQVVFIDGVEIVIPAGSYSLEDLLAELNVTSTAMFSAIYEGENAFHVEITDYTTINFAGSYQLQKLLGISTAVLQSSDATIRYLLTSSNNTVVIKHKGADYSMQIPTGTYSYSEFLVQLLATIERVVHVDNIVFVDTNLEDPLNPICGEIRFVIEGEDSANPETYFNRASTSNTLQNYPWTFFFRNATEIKNLSLARADEILPRRNDCTFLDDTYIDYDYALINTTGHYFKDLEYYYKFTDKTTNTYITDGTVQIPEGSKGSQRLLEIIAEELNKRYREYYNLPESHQEAIAWTTSKYDNYKWQMTANDFAPNLELNVRCSNSPAASDIFVYENTESPKRHYITSYWYASKCMRISYIQIPQKIKLTIKIDDTGKEKDYYIEATRNGDTTVLAPLIKGFLDDLFGIECYSVKAYYGELHIYRISEAVSTISVKCSHEWFPFKGNNISDVKLRFYLNQIIKMPNLLNRTACLNFIYQNGVNFVTMNNNSWFFYSHNTGDYNNTRHEFKSSLPAIRCQYCNPTTLKKISPPFLVNFLNDLAPISGAGTAYSTATQCYDAQHRKAIQYAQTHTVTYVQGTTEIICEPMKGHQNQFEFIYNLNTAFAKANIPLQFEMRRDGYYAEGIDCTLTGNFLTNGQFEVMETSTKNGVTTFYFSYWHDMQYQADSEAYFCSENLIDITYGREILNIYSDIINGKIDSKITSMEISDLHKNYLSRKTIIPVRNSFNRIKFVLKDSNDRDYEINGRMFITLHLSTL